MSHHSSFFNLKKTRKGSIFCYSVLMAITSQTNDSIKESKHYDNEDAVCVPSDQNR